MAEINSTDLTQGTIEGTGVFDELMRATEAHIDKEFSKNRIKGVEYSQVYLGGMQAAMQYGIQFLLQRQSADAEAELVRERVATERLQQALLSQQVLRETAQTALLVQQRTNLEAEALNIPKQGKLLDQELLNATKDNEVKDKQICKLEAEFDLLMEQKLKVGGETSLLSQKKVTEKAQTVGSGVDIDSIIGRQKGLYHSQAEGLKRDAEQKAAKVFADTWNVRRTTDEGTQANTTNRFDDATIGQVMAKLINGI